MAYPSKYKPEMCNRVIELLASGLTKKAAAGELGVSKQAFYGWLDKHEEFAKAVQIGEAKGQAFWERLGISGVSGELEKFAASAWIFRMKQYGWTDKVDHQSSDGSMTPTPPQIIIKGKAPKK